MKLRKLRNIVATAVATLAIAVIFPTSVSAAWKQDSNGWWNTKGSSYSTSWESINNTWYYFGQDGYMKTGWINNNGSWYFADNSGAMKTGWINNNGSWYFTNNSGVMQTGWTNSNGTWYFTNGSGAMQNGWINNNGVWYYADQSGAMQTGLVTINNNTYYFDQSGAMKTGNIIINGMNYTFAPTGEKVNSTQNTTNNNNNTTNSNSDKDTSSSGGSGGSSGGSGGGSTDSHKLSSNSSYSDLYGRWTVKKHVESKIDCDLSDKVINLGIDESFIVKSDRITSIPLTIMNPIIEEDKLTASEFKDEYGDSLSNIGISGNKVKCITVTDKDNSNRTVDVLVSDNGSVYAIVKGAVFKLSRG